MILDEVLFFYRRREGSMSRDCTRGDAHLDSVEHIVRKHEPSYRAHLAGVSRWKDASLADLDARNATLEAGVARHTAAHDRLRFRDELAALKRAGSLETEAQRTRLAAAEAAYQAASAEAARCGPRPAGG